MRKPRRRGEHAFPGALATCLDVKSRCFVLLKQQVMDVQRFILSVLNFALSPVLGTRSSTCWSLWTYLKGGETLARGAWSSLNDFTRTTVACQYQPHAIAVTSIYLAATVLDVALARTLPWWQVFDVELAEIQAIVPRLWKR